MMRHLVLTSMLITCSAFCYSQAVITKPTSRESFKSIKDFGAIPGDGKDDTWAFIKAGKYFSNLWDINGVPLKAGQVNFSYHTYSAKLEIFSGTYLVGKQINIPVKGLQTTYGNVFGYPEATAPLIFAAGGAYKAGLELMLFSSQVNKIDQLVIRGVGKSRPVIKYNDGMVLGFFNHEGLAQFLPENNYKGNYAVSIGNFIYAEGCRNIVLDNVEIDGNNTPVESGGGTKYNGGYAAHLIQMGGSGAYFVNTQNVTVKNSNFHHMTMDGLIFHDYYKDPAKFSKQPLSNLDITNTNCNYNRRQGFSWVGGRNIKVTNSTFNNTGTTVSGLAAGNPAAGVDIEPEQDPGGNLLWCLDGRFLNCEFINNKGVALVNDVTALRTKKVNFDGCTFHDVDGYAVWVKGKTIRFTNCRIWGGFVYGNEGLQADDATIFNNCDFADEEIKGRPGVYNVGYALIESWQTARRMRFNNCTFRTLHSNQRLAAIFTPSSSETGFTIFSNCRFTVGAASHGNNILFGCVFDKNNKITSNNKIQIETININGVVFTGSTQPTSPFNFTLEGNILFFPANSNGMGLKQFIIGRKGMGSNATDGFANFIIGAGSCLYAYWDQTIDIGRNSTFINKAGGQLAMLSGKLNNGGTIILEDNSNTAFFNPVYINTATAGAPQFYFNKKAKMALTAFWAVPLKELGGPIPLSRMNITGNTKFRGGNAGIPADKAVSNK